MLVGLLMKDCILVLNVNVINDLVNTLFHLNQITKHQYL